jgi:hypothetical protein
MNSNDTTTKQLDFDNNEQPVDVNTAFYFWDGISDNDAVDINEAIKRLYNEES